MDEIVDLVKQWYSNPKYWVRQGKCYPDTVMLNIDSMVKDKVVLDLGCFFPSTEMAAALFADRWVAIDFLPEVIDRCKALKHPSFTYVEFLVMDMMDLKFQDETFDTVLDFSSGDQMPEESYNKAIGEACRVLKKGGHFLIAYSSRECFKVKEEYGNFGYSKFYTAKEIGLKLKNVGFFEITHYKHKLGRAGVKAKKSKDWVKAV